MRHLHIILAILMLAISVPIVHADDPDQTNIIEAITDIEGTVVVIQPEGLAQRVMPFAVIKTNTPKKDRSVDPGIRYRVQVFSDNNRQNAKANAEYRKRMIEQRMPGVPGFVTYEAPYWRVRVGNYQTEAEAYTVMKQIKSQFPAFSSDVRVVKVRVN